ncbi:MAG: hypothetical protein U9R26_08325 [Campylobacterota bacterium]|nr:hypothetical protein [Campylobacterota bacterium]
MTLYRVDGIAYRVATKLDEPVLKKLLGENSMHSWVNITLRREPNYFDADNLMGESVTVIAHKQDNKKTIIGMYSCTLFKLFFRGKEESIVYLNSLRVNPDFRHKIRFLKEGFVSIGKLIPFRATLPFMFTSIASENFSAKRVLESNMKGMPRYVPLAKMSTFTFTANRARINGLCQKAGRSDINSIARFYNQCLQNCDFAPVMSKSWLTALDGSKGLRIEDFYLVKSREGEIKAVFALWDQRKIKQVVIESYKPPLDKFRFLYNIYAKISGGIPLPKEGSSLEQIFIAFFATLSKERQWIVEILKEASMLTAEKDAALCTIGFASGNPICTLMRDALQAKEYQTDIEAVFLSGSAKKEIDVSNIQPEIALL